MCIPTGTGRLPEASSIWCLQNPRMIRSSVPGITRRRPSCFKRGLYGEAVTHLERAAAVLPDEARALFDRASYSEIQGLPVNQVLLSDEDLSLIHISEPTRLGMISYAVF